MIEVLELLVSTYSYPNSEMKLDLEHAKLYIFFLNYKSPGVIKPHKPSTCVLPVIFIKGRIHLVGSVLLSNGLSHVLVLQYAIFYAGSSLGCSVSKASPS